MAGSCSWLLVWRTNRVNKSWILVRECLADVGVALLSSRAVAKLCCSESSLWKVHKNDGIMSWSRWRGEEQTRDLRASPQLFCPALATAAFLVLLKSGSSWALGHSSFTLTAPAGLPSRFCLWFLIFSARSVNPSGRGLCPEAAALSWCHLSAMWWHRGHGVTVSSSPGGWATPIKNSLIRSLAPDITLLQPLAPKKT